MTTHQIGKLWTTLSLFLTYYAINSWIVTQGGNEILGAKLVVSGRAPAALLAIPICTVLILLASSVGRLYSRRSQATNWAGRIPVVGFDDISAETTEGRFYQAGMLVLLSFLPALSLIHFWHLVLSARIAPTADLSASIPSIWDWSHFGWNDPARICSDYESASIPCAHNATVLPGLEPTCLAVLTGLALFSMGAHLASILRSCVAKPVDAESGG